MNNLGPGLGEVASHYATVKRKLILCLAMLMGRLEVFTLLVLLTPLSGETDTHIADPNEEYDYFKPRALCMTS